MATSKGKNKASSSSTMTEEDLKHQVNYAINGSLPPNWIIENDYVIALVDFEDPGYPKESPIFLGKKIGNEKMRIIPEEDLLEFKFDEKVSEEGKRFFGLAPKLYYSGEQHDLYDKLFKESKAKYLIPKGETIQRIEIYQFLRVYLLKDEEIFYKEIGIKREEVAPKESVPTSSSNKRQEDVVVGPTTPAVSPPTPIPAGSGKVRQRPPEGDRFDVLKESGSRFRLKRALFTYKDYVDKELIKQHFEKLIREKWPKEYTEGEYEITIAHEPGTKKEETYKHPHTHVMVEFPKTYETRKNITWMINQEHIPFSTKVIPNEAQYKYCLAFMGNEDPENEHLCDMIEFDQGDVQLIYACATLEEALELWPISRGNLGLAGKITSVWKNKPEKFVPFPCDITYEMLRPWQKEEIAFLEKKGNPRKVVWRCGDDGATGKGTIGDYFCHHHPDQGILLRVSKNMTEKDLGAMLLSSRQKMKPLVGGIKEPRVLFIDIPRTANINWGLLYTLLEDICNKTMASGKYKSEMIMLPNLEHIYVTANRPPDPDKLSFDRYDVRQVEWSTEKGHEKEVVVTDVPVGADHKKSKICKSDVKCDLCAYYTQWYQGSLYDKKERMQLKESLANAGPPSGQFVASRFKLNIVPSTPNPAQPQIGAVSSPQVAKSSSSTVNQ